VEKFPTLHFKSKSISIVRAGELAVEGDLTISGVTTRFALPLEGHTTCEGSMGQYPSCGLGDHGSLLIYFIDLVHIDIDKEDR
jgi:polyisoprenoid-binding protein YceI